VESGHVSAGTFKFQNSGKICVRVLAAQGARGLPQLHLPSLVFSIILSRQPSPALLFFKLIEVEAKFPFANSISAFSRSQDPTSTSITLNSLRNALHIARGMLLPRCADIRQRQLRGWQKASKLIRAAGALEASRL
jgi:hypothetical protein